MSNIRLGTLNRAVTATLTASPVEGLGAVTNLQLDDRSLFVAAASGTQTLYLTWGGTTLTDTALVLYMDRLNAAYNDTLSIALYTNSDWTGATLYAGGAVAAYTSGLYGAWGFSAIKRYFTATGSWKSAKLVFSTAAALQGARMYLGPYTEAPYNPAFGAQLSYESNSKQSRSEGGSLRAMRKALWRALQVEMMYRTEADRAAWLEIARYCDVDRMLLVDVFPGDASATLERDHCFLAKFEKSPAMKLADWSRYDQSARLLEI